MKLKPMMTGLMLIVAASVAVAQSLPRKAVQVEPDQFDEVSGIYFYCDETTKEAYIQDVYPEATEYYSQETFTVPSQITINGLVISFGGDSQSGKIFKITALGVEALRMATSKQVVFTEPSNVRVIRERGMALMSQLTGTLTLPSSLKVIETNGIFSGTEGGQMPVTKLVIPAGIDSLGMSSVVLNQVEEIEFLGTTPPKVYNDGNGVLPWTISKTSAYNTPKSITITVPQGAEANYKAAAGIGDYFDYFTKETPTALDNMREAVAPATKSFRNGMLIIERNGVKYTPTGQRL